MAELGLDPQSPGDRLDTLCRQVDVFRAIVVDKRGPAARSCHGWRVSRGTIVPDGHDDGELLLARLGGEQIPCQQAADWANQWLAAWREFELAKGAAGQPSRPPSARRILKLIDAERVKV